MMSAIVVLVICHVLGGVTTHDLVLQKGLQWFIRDAVAEDADQKVFPMALPWPCSSMRLVFILDRRLASSNVAFLIEHLDKG